MDCRYVEISCREAKQKNILQFLIWLANQSWLIGNTSNIFKIAAFFLTLYNYAEIDPFHCWLSNVFIKK